MFPTASGIVYRVLKPATRPPFSILSLNLGLATLPLTVLGGAFTVLVYLDYLRLSSDDIIVIAFAPLLVYPLYFWVMAKTSPMPRNAGETGRRWAVLLAGICAAALSASLLVWYLSFATDGRLVSGRWLWLSMAGVALLYVAASVSFYLVGVVRTRLRPIAVTAG